MGHFLRRFIPATLLAFLVFISQAIAQAESEQELAELYDLVYQIVVIETETNNKTAIGSGFQVSETGLVITNYHVVSNIVFEPDHHRLEFVAEDGSTGPLDLLSFDVINDLALLKRENAPREHLALAQELPARGDSIFAIGNPRDIGMLMVSGAYNGLAESSYTDQILYSGSLNSGMSGGPTVNAAGEVVGVNVATAGSQLSFLIPVSKVYALLPNANSVLQPENYLEHIGTQIDAFQLDYFSQLLDADWMLEDLGEQAQVPGEMGLDTNCWGRSNEDVEDTLLLELSLQCNNSNRIYLRPNFLSGILHYSYFYAEAKDISSFHFHKLISDRNYLPDNPATQKEVTPYECEQSYISPSAGEPEDNYVQIGFCSRAYINIEGLYDTLFYRTSAGDSRSLTTHFTLAGVNLDVAQRFTQRFMEEVRWK